MGVSKWQQFRKITVGILWVSAACSFFFKQKKAYEIYWATGDWHEVTIGNQQFVQLPGLPEGNDYMIEVAAVPTVTGT